MTFISMILVLAASSTSFASYSTLCTIPYSNDVFKTDLRLAVSKEAGNLQYVLWMDTHIPYGIRPLPHTVKALSCKDSGLKIAAIYAEGIYSLKFQFAQKGTEAIQPGTLSYYDESGNKTGEKTMNCPADSIRRFCESL